MLPQSVRLCCGVLTGHSVAGTGAPVAEAGHRLALGLSPLGVTRHDAVGHELQSVSLAVGEASGDRALRLLNDRQRAGARLVEGARRLDPVAHALGGLW